MYLEVSLEVSSLSLFGSNLAWKANLKSMIMMMSVVNEQVYLIFTLLNARLLDINTRVVKPALLYSYQSHPSEVLMDTHLQCGLMTGRECHKTRQMVQTDHIRASLQRVLCDYFVLVKPAIILEQETWCEDRVTKCKKSVL